MSAIYTALNVLSYVISAIGAIVAVVLLVLIISELFWQQEEE